MSAGQVLVPYAAIQEAFEKGSGLVQEAVYQAADEAAKGDTVERAHLIASWNEALSALASEDHGDSVMSTAQNALASRLQTFLAVKASSADKVRTVQPAQAVRTEAGETITTQVLEIKFDPTDLAGWIRLYWKLFFHKPKKHAWITPPRKPETLADDAEIAVFGDWATGLYGAPIVARSIAAMERCDVALHLGDTYYSGADKEIRDELVGFWPQRKDKTVNRSLNGNHEMYSGGVGYFKVLDSFFKQPASCFAMQNSKWILVCLDTAYVDFDIDKAQVAWLESIIKGAGKRKLILFSHHQPFSQLGQQGPNIQIALASLLDTQRIYAWFWGHEHRLVLYDAHWKWGFKGRCVGHGGFPAFRDVLHGAGGEKYKWIGLKEKTHAPAARLFDGPNHWITEHPNRYGPHGYLTLEFKGDDVMETYRLPDSSVVEHAKL